MTILFYLIFLLRVIRVLFKVNIDENRAMRW
jgi:hypothetical protein